MEHFTPQPRWQSTFLEAVQAVQDGGNNRGLIHIDLLDPLLQYKVLLKLLGQAWGGLGGALPLG